MFVTASLPAIDIPVLVASSDHDGVVDPANADALAAAMTSTGHGVTGLAIRQATRSTPIMPIPCAVSASREKKNLRMSG